MLSVSPSPGITLTLQNRFEAVFDQTQGSLTRLSTGKRINAGRDDPAGLVRAEQQRSELTAIQAELNRGAARRLPLADGASQLSFVQRGLVEVQGNVVSAAGDTLSQPQKGALQLELDATLEAFGRLAPDHLPTDTLSLVSGGDANLVDGDTTAAADAVAAAHASARLAQADVAAEQRALDYQQKHLRDKQAIVAQGLSQTEDADFAEETARFAVAQILTRATNLAQIYSQRSHADAIGGLLDTLNGE